MKTTTDDKIVSINEVGASPFGDNERLRRNDSLTIVYAHGCCDALHPEHIAHLKEAKSLGDILLVGVTSDRYVSKGCRCPVHNQDERMRQVAALQVVDWVILSDHPTGCEIIDIVKPDIFVKGSDFKGRHIPEEDAVAAYGGVSL